MEKSCVLLTILDGWGLGQLPDADAVAQAETPFMDQLMAAYPHNHLVTYGEAVGLPEGQMGNSEVGHLNIGAGRVVYQELARINKEIREGFLARNPTLEKIIQHASTAKKPLHLLGLVSDGGVHAHISHLEALVDIVEKAGLNEIYIHAFTDGRDTDPRSGAGFLSRLDEFLRGRKTRLASVVGRYFAMDRDQRWERVKVAYDLLVRGEGSPSDNLSASVTACYEKGVTDEFIAPCFATRPDGTALATIREGDVVLCFNFRTDRPRQIIRVLTQEDFPALNMKKLDITCATMTQYDESFRRVEVLFQNDNLRNTLGEVLAASGKTQVRIAETEKYPHVTFFFSGGRETPFPGEERILVPSPKVATYDLEPGMSAKEITRRIREYLQEHHPDFICLNYANADMVGHTGSFNATKTAVERVDECLSSLIPAALACDYKILVLADHGNADFMVNADGSPNTAHTMNPVPLLYVGKDSQSYRVAPGKLADIAPTVLHLMGLPEPVEMTGTNLVIPT